MAKVTLTKVTKTYPAATGGDVVVVRDFSLEIADREFVVLTGPAGCGKSTILRMIAGLEEISGGDISIGDRRVNDVPPQDRDLAMVFQEDALYPHMTVRENLTFGLKRRKFGQAEIEKRVAGAAAVLALAEFLDRKPDELALEQRQRVAVARAIVRQPKVFLFDEPLSNLRGKARAQMRAEITKLHQRVEATMIYATDNPEEAMMMGERIVVMNGGIVEQAGAPLEVYNQPINLFVAGFLGRPPMNLLHGTLKQERDALVFTEREEGTIVARFPASERAAAVDFTGKPVVLGIRPEDIEVSDVEKGRENPAGVFPAIVDLVEVRGPETMLHLDTGAHTLVCRSDRAFDQRGAGRRMRFAMDPQKAHLFDTVTGLRIA